MQTPEFSYKDNLSKLKVKRTRKKTSYTKINNETRKKLIEMVIVILLLLIRFTLTTIPLRMLQVS